MRIKKAIVREFTVDVDDGILNIDLINQKDKGAPTIINGIEIFRK
jgi:hypothetical protein